MLVEFSNPLIKGTLVKRYNRFLADVVLDSGETITAHCPNTGSMKTCYEKGSTIYLSFDPSPKRKLSYTWEFTQVDDGLIGINTARPNRIVEEAIRQNLISELNGYDSIRREVAYGKNSKIDLLLESSHDTLPPCYVEIKNATLIDEGNIKFPDAVSARGLKHLNELSEVSRSGKRAVMFFLVNRPEGKYFSPAEHIDPEYAKGLKAAFHDGVEILIYRSALSPSGISLGKKVPLDPVFLNQ